MDNISRLYRLIEDHEIGGEEVANFFTGYHGNQIVDDEFLSFVMYEWYGDDETCE